MLVSEVVAKQGPRFPLCISAVGVTGVVVKMWETIVFLLKQ